MNRGLMIAHLRAANKLAVETAASGHHPFAALLIAPNNRDVLLSHGNVDTVRHAETELVRMAAQKLKTEELAKCTLVTTVEPCAMCAGAIYWANIGTSDRLS
jgi:tRNA(Arg) A34 adenosine deaminase TadA